MHHSTAMRARKFMTLSYSKACLQRGGLWCCMVHGNGHVVPLPPEQVRASNGYMPSGDIVLICAAAFSWNTGIVWIEVSSFADSYFLSQLWDTGDLFSSGCRCSNHPSGAHNRACSRARCFVLSTVKVRGYYPGGFSFPFVAVVTQLRCLPVPTSVTWGAQQGSLMALLSPVQNRRIFETSALPYFVLCTPLLNELQLTQEQVVTSMG